MSAAVDDVEHSDPASWAKNTEASEAFKTWELQQRNSESGSKKVLVRKRRPVTILETVSFHLNDQDSVARMTTALVVTMEFYRLLVSSLLLIFVPQRCGDHACSYTENMQVTGTSHERRLYTCGLFFNYCTLASFLILYAIEITREERLIRHLEVSPRVKADNLTMKAVLSMLEPLHLKELREVQSGYKVMGVLVTVLFAVNTVISAVIIANFSQGNLTVSTFVTNVLFMVQKLSTIHTANSAEENIFLSAYSQRQLQYNALDGNEAKHDAMMALFGSVVELPEVVHEADPMEMQRQVGYERVEG